MCVIAAVGAATVATLLLAWDSASLGAGAQAFGTQLFGGDFADRFNAVRITARRRERTVLALNDPELENARVRSRELETISPDARDDIFSISPRATRARAATTPVGSKAVPAATTTMTTKKKKTSKVARAASKEGAASVATLADFLAPDVSKLVVPAAALSLMTLSVTELSRRELAAASPVNESAGALTSPAPIIAPLKLSGPFHLFFTTAPANGNVMGDSNAGGSGGGNAMATNNGVGNGNGNGNNNNGNNNGSNAGGNGNGNGNGKH